MKKAWNEMALGFFGAYSYVITMVYSGTEGANAQLRCVRQCRKAFAS